MKQKDFERLVASVKQAGTIRRGQLKPAQTTEFRPEDMDEIRTQTRNVFLSFSTEDKGLADLFRDQARDRQPALVFRDYSIKETFEHAWKTNAGRLIRACSVTICLIEGSILLCNDYGFQASIRSNPLLRPSESAVSRTKRRGNAD